ncbi:MAG: hypothetical protein KZQ80_14195 [Candidatus Thiodiazotropha sp. (ex Monitilora ramsayi)]|nr:hypothetical protein [Candidatus Thiodiazotropha sp. (ex Monitilora ramsayi)]
MRNSIIAALISLVFVTGCASTKIESTGALLKEPLCHAEKAAVSTLVYWGPKWRSDQKEPQLREAAALRGIESFLKRAGCIEVNGIHRLSWKKQPQSNEELLNLASKSVPESERVLLIVIRELGPWLEIGIPAILEGGTEVLIDVRVLNPQTSGVLASTQTLWRNGGKFVVKGVKTLDQDISSALSTVLMPGFSDE